MLNGKRWIHKGLDDRDIEKLINETGISYLLSSALVSRGIKDSENASKFLKPDLKDLHDPFLLPDMDKAVDRIIKAVSNGEKVVLYGDYDADGVTGISILYDFLLGLGGKVDYYIPDRLEEGYGLSVEALGLLIDKGAELIVTVDCGITAIEEAAFAREKGIDMVITDHHECKGGLPDAHAIVNPCKPGCRYPFKELAGVGVVFKLINAICMKLSLGDLHLRYLDLVAVGTIADIVPLKDENRVIAKYGLDMIPSSSNTGLRALLNKSGLEGKAIGSFEVGYIIGPRINAAGRTGDATEAVKLFTTGDVAEALGIAEELEKANILRQGIEQTIYNQAIEIIESQIDIEQEKFIVAAKERWHHGVIGIVASRITERYYKPCILISIDGDMGTGSGRSVESFNIFNALKYCEDLLEKYGGHELAAGLRIRRESINEFRRQINEYANRVMVGETLIPKIRIDAYVDDGRELNLESAKELELLAPFGPGNPVPVFGFRDVGISEVRGVGSNSKHLKLKLDSEGLKLDAIGFNMGSAAGFLQEGDTLDVAARIELNCWNSTTCVQLNLLDIKRKYNGRDYCLSLEKCLEAECKHIMDQEAVLKKSRTGEFPPRELLQLEIPLKETAGEKDLSETLEKLSVQGSKTLIFVNSRKTALELGTVLKNHAAGTGKNYSVCYTGLDYMAGELTMVINPLPDGIDCKKFDTAIFAGDWITPSCMLAVLDSAIKAKREIILYKCNYERDAGEKNTGEKYPGEKDAGGSSSGEIFREIQEVIPERADLAILYRYIKKYCKNEMVVDDLFMFAMEISKEYNIFMNYVKLKKVLDILYELGLLEIFPAGDKGVLLKYEASKVRQVKLEDSLTYRLLQKLKY